MIELSIPQAGEETKNAKDLVFSILSDKQPLSTIEIFNTIKTYYTISLTYQAVKKAIDNLLDKKVLIKKGKKYSINKEWLIDLKRNVDKLLTTYQKKQHVKTFSADLATQQYAVYTFTNLIDCDNFWDDLLFYLADHIKEDEPHSFLVHSHYNWWFLINLGQETKLHKYLIKNKFNTHFLIIGDNPLNKWAKDLYKGVGVKAKIVEDKEVEEAMTLNVIGDTVIQTYYPKEIIKILRNIYKNYKKTQDIPLKVITELANKQCEIKLNVFKNREIANSLREKYLKKFKSHHF
jgi:hypothetical protein